MTNRIAPISNLRRIRPLRDFLHAEAAGSVLILAAVAVALSWANSPWSDAYERLWTATATFDMAGHTLSLDLRHWVSDGAMTLFFLVVGLEIKRELTVGQMSDRRKAVVPIVAAIGGMAIPGLLYLTIAPGEAHGWAVPTATDIALAVGALSVLSDRVPGSLRAFLLTLAIVDDIAAVLVIAVFYTDGLRLAALAATVAVTIAVYTVRRYLTPGRIGLVCAVLWLLLHEAGVHATLAGVIAGFLAPLTPARQPDFVDSDDIADITAVEIASHTVYLARQSVSTLEWLEHRLHPWSTMLVVPLFALANAGIRLDTTTLTDASTSPVAWAVLAGLVVGKPFGIVAATLIATRAFGSQLPVGTDTRDIVGVGALGGIGFTISLVIASRAFDDPTTTTNATLAILIGSILAATIGLALLHRPRRTAAQRPTVDVGARADR